MKAGDIVRVKVGETGEKVTAVVTDVNIHTDQIETTLGGLTPGGPPPDPYRKFVLGRSQTTITLVVQP